MMKMSKRKYKKNMKKSLQEYEQDQEMIEENREVQIVKIEWYHKNKQLLETSQGETSQKCRLLNKMNNNKMSNKIFHMRKKQMKVEKDKANQLFFSI